MHTEPRGQITLIQLGKTNQVISFGNRSTRTWMAYQIQAKKWTIPNDLYGIYPTIVFPLYPKVHPFNQLLPTIMNAITVDIWTWVTFWTRNKLRPSRKIYRYHKHINYCSGPIEFWKATQKRNRTRDIGEHMASIKCHHSRQVKMQGDHFRIWYKSVHFTAKKLLDSSGSGPQIWIPAGKPMADVMVMRVAKQPEPRRGKNGGRCGRGLSPYPPGG